MRLLGSFLLAMPTEAHTCRKLVPPERSGFADQRIVVGWRQASRPARQSEADPFDLLCHVAFDAPARTRRERAKRLKQERKDLLERFAPDARALLNELLEKYAEHGTAHFVIPDVLKVPPISERGNVLEIANLFGGPAQLRAAVNQLQTLLYAA